MKTYEYFKLTEERGYKIIAEIDNFYYQNNSTMLEVLTFVDLHYKDINENRFAINYCGFLQYQRILDGMIIAY